MMYGKMLGISTLKISWIFFILIFSTMINGSERNVIESRNDNKTSNLYIPKMNIKKSRKHYVYGPDGDRVVSVNFDKSGRLVSKTTYESKNLNYSFIFDEYCNKGDCQQFIHD